ncbi:hypothetical protein [Rhodococcus sp. IEGM 1307]|uniref:hypothetical protein n=1 Tax=Rhodococcus sp. IEGM 1307 TaxID=3047091 RepID=UPI0024B6ED7D|nr:hypothetical protein [Rhodococcus sp. IEGM 1307]MDI9978639.1 hypothetical protein [Rhodococcus sp. IEGM 1307]
MKQLPQNPTGKNPPEQFTGDVWVDPIAAPQEPGQRMVVACVRFAPSARTAWHSHENGDDPATTTTWLEHVDDADYTRAHNMTVEA